MMCDTSTTALSRLRLPVTVPVMAFVLALVPAAAFPRAFHSVDSGDVTVRCSTVNSTSLPEASLQRYAIDGDPAVGLFSCVLQRSHAQESPEHLHGDVTVHYHSIGQTPAEIPLREVLDDRDLVTYLGTYRVPDEFPLTFRVSVESDDIGSLEFTFDDNEPQI
jgi:hypothetical protein